MIFEFSRSATFQREPIVSPHTDIFTVHYLRAIAALAVTLSHFMYSAGSAGGSAAGLGRFGVDIFFVVSGFIVPYSLWSGNYRLENYTRFIIKRLVRLEPAYLAGVALSVVLAYAAVLHPSFRGPNPDITVAQLTAHLFYLAPLTGHSWVNGVYWSLAYEFAFYLTIGILFPLCVRREPLFLVVGLACFAAAALALEGTLQAHRIGLFYMGLAAFRHFSGLDGARTFALNVALGTAMVLSNPYTLANAALDLDTASCFVGTLTAICLVATMRRPPAALLFFSQISYSLYLLHVPIGSRVVHLVERLLPGTLGDVCGIAAALIVSIVAAYIWCRLFEVPCLRLSRRITYGRVHTAPTPLKPHFATSG